MHGGGGWNKDIKNAGTTRPCLAPGTGWGNDTGVQSGGRAGWKADRASLRGLNPAAGLMAPWATSGGNVKRSRPLWPVVRAG